jgi:predicted ArsR family transcriptional regulator
VRPSALADPTRLQIYLLLLDADAPLDIPALTRAAGVHHNSVRRHLTRLVDAGLAVATTERRSLPGRPRLTYAPSTRSLERWGTTGPYERLSLLLSEVIRSGDSPAQVGRRAALRERLGARSAGAPVDELVESMERHGFDPSVRLDGDHVTVTLRRCPFERVALADPDTVCQLHLGLANGVAELAGHMVIDELVPRDPRHAHCELHAHVTAPDGR